MNPIYKFEISSTTPAAWSRVFPTYKDDLALDYGLEQNQEFYRAKMTGKLIFSSVDYDYIASKAFDTKFDLRVHLSTDGGTNWKLLWAGQFWKTDITFDGDARTATVTPAVNDSYNAILAGIEKEFNLIDLAPEISRVWMDKRPMIQIYVRGQTSIGCFLSNMWWEQECESITSDSALRNTYHFFKAAAFGTVSLTPSVPQAGLPAYMVGAAHTTGSKNYTDSFIENGYLFMRHCRDNSGLYPVHYDYYIYSGATLLWSYSADSAVRTLPYAVVLNPVAGSGASGTVTVYLENIDIYARIMCDVDSIGGVSTADVPAEDITANNRNYSKVAGYNIANTIFPHREFSATPTKWGIYQPGQYYTPAASTGACYPVARSRWSWWSLWFMPDAASVLYERGARKAYQLKDCFPLSSAISVLLGAIAPGITHEATTDYSEFLYSQNNPITGMELGQLFIAPKSNIINSDYDQPAQKATITLKQITDMLRDCYRCYWFIDDEGRFRIEHIKWFMAGGSYSDDAVVGLDLTRTTITRNGKPWSFGRNQWEYDKPEMPERYQFGWMDDVTELFMGYPIDIMSKYVTAGNIEQIDVSQFTSDIDYILLNPDEITEDGFVIMNAIYDEDVAGLKVPYFTFTISTVEYELQNAFLSFQYLQYFYAYDMPAKKYSINGSQRTAIGVKKLKTQTLKFPVDFDTNLTELVKTEIGDGTIQKLSINLSSQTANATLKYDTE